MCGFTYCREDKKVKTLKSFKYVLQTTHLLSGKHKIFKQKPHEWTSLERVDARFN